MSDIELPGYETLKANEIYTKRVKDHNEIIQLSKFTSPDEKKITDFIKKCAREIDNPDNRDYFGESLIRVIQSFPRSEIEKIANSEKNIMKFIKDNSCLDHGLPGRSYLRFNKMSILNSRFEEIMILSPGEERGKAFSDELNNNGKNIADIYLQLNENGSLISSRDLEYLVSNGVTYSHTLFVRGQLHDSRKYQIIADSIRMLYKEINSPDVISKIEDESEDILRFQALRIAEKTSEYFLSKDFIQFIQELKETVKGSLEMQDENSSGNKEDSSLN